MSIYSPELLWQGGADNGKPEPVFSLDMHPSNVLATAGNDENIPPKGSVRLWRIDVDKDGQEFIIEFSDHQSVVNTVRFSPCGRMIASASDKQIVVYKGARGFVVAIFPCSTQSITDPLTSLRSPCPPQSRTAATG